MVGDEKEKHQWGSEMRSLLGYLASKHVVQREVLATDAVVFLLAQSEAARAGVAALLGLSGTTLSFEGQAVDESARPDIAARDGRGRLRGLIEGKFWAGLTENQPGEYLRMLEHEGGPLIFVAPRARHQALWGELLSRVPHFVRDAKQPFTAVHGNTRLVLTGWRELLQAMAPGVGGTPLEAELHQLEGMVREFEADGHLPLQPEQLTNLETPRVVRSLSDLAEEIAQAAKAANLVSMKGLRETHGWYSAGRYFLIGERVGAWFGLDHGLWSEFGTSPLWLRFWSEGWSARSIVRRVFSARFVGDAPTAFERDDGAIVLSVPVEPRAERSAMVSAGVESIRQISAALEAAGVELLQVRSPKASAEGE
jgi:hypothetical protein